MGDHINHGHFPYPLRRAVYCCRAGEDDDGDDDHKGARWKLPVLLPPVEDEQLPQKVVERQSDDAAA